MRKIRECITNNRWTNRKKKIKVIVHLFLTTTNLDVKDWKLLITRWILRTYRKQDLTLFCLQETHEMDTKVKTK